MEVPDTALIDAVRELARGAIAARAAASDRAGTFCAESIEDLRRIHVPAMSLPKDVGGLGVTAETHVRVVEEVAYGDGSTAVALNMHLFTLEALHALPPFPRRNLVVDDIGRNGEMICGVVSIPTGEIDNRGTGLVVREDGADLVVNGKLGFASNSEASKYIFAAGSMAREGGETEIVLIFPELNTPGLRVMNNWDAMGLRSTASHDVSFEDVRIPKADALVLPVSTLRVITEAANANPALGASRVRGTLGILAIWLGLAQAAFDFTVAYVQKRHGMVAGDASLLGPIGYRSDEPWAQSGLGEMDAWLTAGREALYGMVRRLDSPFESTQAFNHATVRTIYLMRRASEEVSAGSMRICGAHAYVRGRGLERIFRDMVGGNVMAWKTDQLRQTLGQAALGMPIAIGGPAPA